MNCCSICGTPLLWFSLFVILSRHIYLHPYACFYSVNTNFVIEAILLIVFGFYCVIGLTKTVVIAVITRVYNKHTIFKMVNSKGGGGKVS